MQKSSSNIRLLHYWLLGSLLLITTNTTHALSREPHAPTAAAPSSIAGSDIVLQIENAVTNYTSGFPYKGAVVVNYKKDGTFSAQGYGTMKGNVDANQQTYAGTYHYSRTGFNTATEKAIDTSLQKPYTTKYIFETETSGKWEQNFDNGQILYTGSFTIVPHNPQTNNQFAPTNISGLTVALLITDATSTQLPPDVYGKRGFAMQSYLPNGTMTIKGFGKKMLDSTGTYTYTKISANIAVEEVMQTSNLFVWPYTMVYTFDTPTSGTWFQNLGDGILKFHGTFETVEN